MKGRLYWATRHIRRSIHDLRFAATCWWLSQRVNFLEWPWRLDALMPHAQPIPAPILTTQGSRYAGRRRYCGDETPAP